MPTFSDFDQRGYRTTDVRTGYGEWVTTYEDVVEDEMDISLLDSLATPPWDTFRSAADLGCGTGRTGAWLRRHGVVAIDGVDLTPAMLARASERGIYRRLVEADVVGAGLETAAYDLVSVSLVDEHLPDVAPLYAEAFRLAVPGGYLVLVAYHPHFIMTAGMPTHYTSASGEPVGDVLPAFRKVYDLSFETFDAEALARNCDVVFIGVPGKQSMEPVAALRAAGALADLCATAALTLFLAGAADAVDSADRLSRAAIPSTKKCFVRKTTRLPVAAAAITLPQCLSGLRRKCTEVKKGAQYHRLASHSSFCEGFPGDNPSLAQQLGQLCCVTY